LRAGDKAAHFLRWPLPRAVQCSTFESCPLHSESTLAPSPVRPSSKAEDWPSRAWRIGTNACDGSILPLD